LASDEIVGRDAADAIVERPTIGPRFARVVEHLVVEAVVLISGKREGLALLFLGLTHSFPPLGSRHHLIGCHVTIPGGVVPDLKSINGHHRSKLCAGASSLSTTASQLSTHTVGTVEHTTIRTLSDDKPFPRCIG